MIIKALLAWAGLRAAPHLHDVRVHDAFNDDAATMAGVRVIARQSLKVSQAIASDPTDTHRIDRGLADMRSTMAEVARRADR